MLTDAVAGACFELVEVPARLGNPDYGNIKAVPFYQRLKCRKVNLFLCAKVPRRAEEYKSIGIRIVHKFIRPLPTPDSRVLPRS